MESLSCKHSYAGGDLITLLPGLRKIYHETGKKWTIYQQIDFEAFYYENAIHSTFSEQGRAVTMSRKHFEMMKPLIEAQEYIESFTEWEGQETTLNMDKTRDSRAIPLPYGQLHHLPFLIAPELNCDLSDRWIDVPREKKDFLYHKILINRTERYNNPYAHYFFLKEFESDIVFTGTEKEYDVFCKKYTLKIDYLQVNDFLELTKHIENCRFFIGTQSMCWHISDAIKKLRIVEVCTAFPNSFPTGADGYSFVWQEGLEILFNKLYEKTANLEPCGELTARIYNQEGTLLNEYK